jgi:hypothetical protein
MSGPNHAAFRHEHRPFALCVNPQLVLQDGFLPPSWALIDSGCTANLISDAYVRDNNVDTRELDKPIFPLLADGSKTTKAITHETVDLVCVIRDHVETISFQVTMIPEHALFLGMPWLMAHDPTIIWLQARIHFESAHCLHDHCALTASPNVGIQGQPALLPSFSASLHYLYNDNGHLRSLHRKHVIKFIQSILERDQLPDELIIQAFKLFFPNAPPLLFPPLSSTTTAHIEDTGIEVPAELDKLYTDCISYLDGLPPACSTPHKLDGPSEQELQQVYDHSETSAALLATAQLYLGS